MDCYANPPLMVVEFDKNVENLENDSPLGSPPSTPLHQPSVFFAASNPAITPDANSGFQKNASGAPKNLMQPNNDEDIPMDERRHYQNRKSRSSGSKNTSTVSAMDEDGPDDEKRARMDAIIPKDPTMYHPPPSQNRREALLPSQRLAYNRSNSRKMSGDGLTAKQGSAKDMVSKYETSSSPIMQTPEKEDLISPPKLLLKKSDLWQESNCSRGLPPSSTKRHATQYQQNMDDEEDAAPHDERPIGRNLTFENTNSEIPEDERMAMATAEAKERFAKSSGRTTQPDPPSDEVGLTAILPSVSGASTSFAGELTRQLETLKGQEYGSQNRKEKLDPTTPPMNSLREAGKMNHSSPGRPAPRRLKYGDEENENNDEDELIPKNRARAEILPPSNGKDPNTGTTQNLRRLRLSENVHHQPEHHRPKSSPSAIGQESTTTFSVAASVYPPRVSASVAAALNNTLLKTPRTDTLWDLKTQSLEPVAALESFVGIAKGDLTLCLLPHESDSFSKKVPGASRVHSAICTSRRARRKMGILPTSSELESSALPPIQPIDGGDVIAMHHAGLYHLILSDYDRAIGCYERISSCYKSENQRLSKMCKRSRTNNEVQTICQLSLSVIQQNLGILNLLKREYLAAMSHFASALQARTICLVEGHADQIACLAKISTCQYALDHFDDAQNTLERAIGYARKQTSLSLDDRLLGAEMINDLGTLQLRKGSPEAASRSFAVCLTLLQHAARDCLYEGSESVSHSISLNLLIVKSNAAFTKMVAREFAGAIFDLEEALMGISGLLNSRDDMSIATMDCLATANILSGKKERATKLYVNMLKILRRECDESDPKLSKICTNLQTAKGVGSDAQKALKKLEKSFSMWPITPIRSPSISPRDPLPSRNF